MQFARSVAAKITREIDELRLFRCRAENLLYGIGVECS
jgi:hypothetical protein